MAGGLHKGLEQEWKSDTKYAILIADCPAHGAAYFKSMDDRFPKGDPNGRKIEDLIEQYAKKEVSFNAVKITKHTD